MYPYPKIISLLFHSPLIPCFQVLFKNLLNLITIVFANHSLFYLKKFFFFDQRGKNDSLGILTIHLLRLAYIQSYIYSLGDSHWAKSKGTIKGQEQITLFAIIKDAFSFLFTYIFSSFLPSSSFTFHCLINLFVFSYHPSPPQKNLCSLLFDSLNLFYPAFLSSLSGKLQGDDRKHLMRSSCFLGNTRRKGLLFVLRNL